MDELIEGKIVEYVLTESDADAINRRRTSAEEIARQADTKSWPIGVQAHIGNTARAGDHCPMIIVRYWPNDLDGVNGQVFLDGNDSLWVTSVREGTEQGTWRTRA